MGTDRENVAPGNLCIIWKLNERWPLKKDSVTFLRLLKLLNQKRTPALPYGLRFLILKKGLCHFLTTLKVFNTEKGLHHLFTTLKVFQNSYSGKQSLVKVAYQIIFMIKKLYLLWEPNFIVLGIYFFFGTKFSWNDDTDTCFNVEYMLLDGNFNFLGCYLVVTRRYLMFTTGYCSVVILVTGGYYSFPLLVWTNI